MYLIVYKHVRTYMTDLCSPLMDPTNGKVDCSDDNTCTFSCDVGFTLSGDAVRRCQEDGTWSGTQPTCSQGTSIIFKIYLCYQSFSHEKI